MKKWLARGFVLLLLFVGQNIAAKTLIDAIRVWPSPESTRIVFDLQAPTAHKLFTLSNPNRVVIDLDPGQMKVNLSTIDLNNTLIKKIRTGNPNSQHFRIVLDLQQAVSAKSFALKPNEQYGYRLVVDLDKSPSYTTKPTLVEPTPSRQIARMQERDFIIAIDAGHGGEDPGASGPRGSKEKNIVLSIARKLAALVNQEKEMKAVLIRDGDYYIGLRQRIKKARLAQADLFVSIHADAFKDARAKGASVFTLSANGASSAAARWLAEHENQADLIGGISLDDKDELLASVLLDLSQTASNEASLAVGESILGQIKTIAKLHSRRVQQAGFAVLKSPDIPSVLIETGFISNPTEEKNLRSSRYQTKIAKAIMTGLRAYFRNKPKPRLIPIPETEAVMTYQVKRGDSLSRIAQRYGSTVDQIKSTNNLRRDVLHVGQKLKIPRRG